MSGSPSEGGWGYWGTGQTGNERSRGKGIFFLLVSVFSGSLA